MDGYNYFQVHSVLNQEHDAVLQVLDRESNGVFMGKEHFEGTEEQWEAVPVIYAKTHPDPEIVAKNLEEALKQVEGKITGSLKNVHLETAGQPKLMGTLDITEQDVDKQVPEGKLGISTAYFSRMTEGKDGVKVVNGPVVPNHLLVFPITDTEQPGDKGAFILNQEKKSTVAKLKDMIMSVFQKAEEEEQTNMTPEQDEIPKDASTGQTNPNSEDTTQESQRGVGPTEAQGEKTKHIVHQDDEEEEQKNEEEEEKPPKEDPPKEDPPKEEPAKEEEPKENEGEEDEETTMSEDEMVECLKKSEKYGQMINSMIDLANANDRIAMLVAENERLNMAANTFMDEVKKAQEDLEDKEWATFKAKLPPGMVKGDKEEAVRMQWKKDPKPLLEQALDLAHKQKVTMQEGDEHNSDLSDSGSRTTIGSFNVFTGKYE